MVVCDWGDRNVMHWQLLKFASSSARLLWPKQRLMLHQGLSGTSHAVLPKGCSAIKPRALEIVLCPVASKFLICKMETVPSNVEIMLFITAFPCFVLYLKLLPSFIFT